MRSVTASIWMLLATFRRKNAVFEILRGAQRKTKAAMIGGLGLSARWR
jgi:hypothetical protein